MNKKIEPHYLPPRAGDVKHSLADIKKAKSLLGYNHPVNISSGLKTTVEWFTRHT
jgi:nucleoside-diphosphate-sugar epimerase